MLKNKYAFNSICIYIYIYIHYYLREVGPSRKILHARGVGVRITEIGDAMGRHFECLWGDLSFSVILVLSAHLGAPGTPPGGSGNAECLVL